MLHLIYYIIYIQSRHEPPQNANVESDNENNQSDSVTYELPHSIPVESDEGSSQSDSMAVTYQFPHPHYINQHMQKPEYSHLKSRVQDRHSSGSQVRIRE